jgi:hypothetical protein
MSFWNWISAIVGIAFLTLISAASFDDTDNSAFLPRCLCFLTIAVLLIVYGFGLPRQ